MRKFQVVQVNETVYNFRIVSEDLSIDDKETITKHMITKLGSDIHINFQQEEDIDNTSSGKYRPVINNLLL